MPKDAIILIFNTAAVNVFAWIFVGANTPSVTLSGPTVFLLIGVAVAPVIWAGRILRLRGTGVTKRIGWVAFLVSLVLPIFLLRVL